LLLANKLTIKKFFLIKHQKPAQKKLSPFTQFFSLPAGRQVFKEENHQKH